MECCEIAKGSTFDAALHVSTLNDYIKKHYDSGIIFDADAFLAYAIALSSACIERGEGGPFGAVLVRYAEGVDGTSGRGKPEVIGVGANHVLAWNDPTAHAEVVVIREAAAQNGDPSWHNTILYASCACCPMCLAATMAVGIPVVLYANTPHQAGEVGFSDEKQYDLMRHPLESYTINIKTISDAEQKILLTALGTDDAVIIDGAGKVVASTSAIIQTDNPTATPSMRVIREACKQRAEQTGEPVFDLPEDWRLVSRAIPHPMALVAADWARIGRIRGAHPDIPAEDSPVKDASKIVYVENRFESLPVTENVAVDAPSILAQCGVAEGGAHIVVKRTNNSHIQQQAWRVFEQWKELGLVY